MSQWNQLMIIPNKDGEQKGLWNRQLGSCQAISTPDLVTPEILTPGRRILAILTRSWSSQLHSENSTGMTQRMERIWNAYEYEMNMKWINMKQSILYPHVDHDYTATNRDWRLDSKGDPKDSFDFSWCRMLEPLLHCVASHPGFIGPSPCSAATAWLSRPRSSWYCWIYYCLTCLILLDAALAFCMHNDWFDAVSAQHGNRTSTMGNFLGVAFPKHGAMGRFELTCSPTTCCKGVLSQALTWESCVAPRHPGHPAPISAASQVV